jgi:hypothetical protein
MYNVAGGKEIGIFRLVFNTILGKCSGLNQYACLGRYTYSIKNTKGIYKIRIHLAGELAVMLEV